MGLGRQQFVEREFIGSQGRKRDQHEQSNNSRDHNAPECITIQALANPQLCFSSNSAQRAINSSTVFCASSMAECAATSLAESVTIAGSSSAALLAESACSASAMRCSIVAYSRASRYESFFFCGGP